MSDDQLMKTWNLNKPWRKGDWLIWPDTTLDSVELSDCNDTLEGICYRDISIEDCMDRCPADNCGAGLFVKYKNGKSMCVPIRTGIHPLLTPLYRLRNQSLYNFDPNFVKMSVFVNTKLFPFPPNLANAVFFGDVLELEDVENNRVLDTDIPVKQGPNEYCTLKKGATSVLTLQPVFRSANSIVHDRPIVYGDNFILVVKGTSYVMQVDASGSLIWKDALGIAGDLNMTFYLKPADPSKNYGDIVTYSDKVAIMYNNIGIVVVNEGQNNLTLDTSSRLLGRKAYNNYIHNMSHDSDSDSDLTKSIFNVFFKFKSLTNANYCDDGICKKVISKDIVPAPFPGKWNKAPENVLTSGTYKGKSVFNHSGCWGLCDVIKPGKGTGNTMRLTGNQHLPKFATSPPPPPSHKKGSSLNIILIVISIVVTILIIIGLLLIYKHARKSV